MKSIATIMVLDEASFIHWIMTAPPFTAVIYYRGYLARDRPTFCPTARRALEFASDKQLIWLFQRKLGSEQYDYIAVRRPDGLKDDPLVVPAYFTFRALAANTRDPISLADLRAAE